MPLTTLDAELLAHYEQRMGARPGWEYKIAGGYSPTAIDVVADEGQIKTNDAERSVTYPFAAAQGRDRVGDFFNLAGMETANHERNPQAFLDHGKWCRWSMGLDQNKQKRYTVEIDLATGLATATTFIPDIVREHEQVYEFYKAGILRSGSVGYRTIEESPLGPDREEGYSKGKNLRRTELLETSLVFLPCNQDAVRRMYDEPWAGKSLCDAFREQLEPIRPRKKPWATGIPTDFGHTILTVEVRTKAMGTPNAKTAPVKTKGAKAAGSPSPAMSATDAGAGGALAGPPEDAKDMDNALAKEPVSHNVQRMTDVHYLCNLIREVIDTDPQLLDHPELKQFLLEDVRPKIEELTGSVASKLAETHPDLEPLEGAKSGEEVAAEDDEENAETPGELGAGNEPEPAPKKEPEEGKDADSATTDKIDKPEEEDDEEDEDTKSAKAKNKGAPTTWHATPPKLKSVKANGKGSSSASSNARTKGMNMSQKACMKDVHDHLDACSKHPETPKIQASGHAYWAGKVAEMIDSGSKGDDADAPDPAMDQDEGLDEGKAMKLFTGFSDTLNKGFENQNRMLKHIR